MSARTASPVVYLGDEIAAAGWRLAGARARVCAPHEAATALAAALHDAAKEGARGAPALVLLSAALAPHVPQALLEAALGALAPLVAVVPDTQGAAPLPDLAARLRVQLGLEA